VGLAGEVMADKGMVGVLSYGATDASWGVVTGVIVVEEPHFRIDNCTHGDSP
jgi:hypothetical protein